MNKKESLEKLIAESELSQEDKNFWNFFISAAPDVLIENISELLAEFPEKLSWLTQIYQRKKEAFSIANTDKETSKELLAQIHKEEKEMLASLIKE